MTDNTATNRAYAYSALDSYAGTDVGNGTNKKNETYSRKLKYQQGYNELAHIVAGLQKDIKKINQCITLNGAQEYASKHKNWTAHEADIIGPHGKPDGIKEVFVCDADGNLKVINGMGLSKTSYPYRKAYRTQFPSKDERKSNPFTGFMEDTRQLHGDFDANGAPYYEHNMSAIDAEFANVQPEISVRDLYKQFIFKDVYNSLKDGIKQAGAEPMDLAQIFNKSFSTAFNYHIKLPVLAQILGGDPDQFADKEKNKVLRSKQYKDNSQLSIATILNSGDFSTLQAEIEQLISDTADEVLGTHHELEAAQRVQPYFQQQMASPPGAVRSPPRQYVSPRRQGQRPAPQDTPPATPQ
jgi:hypothetical protein